MSSGDKSRDPASRGPADGRAAKIATIIIMTIMFSVFLLDILVISCFNHYEKRYDVGTEDFIFVGQAAGSRIHFLNTENSDAILLESQGHFALIDSGWGSDHPSKGARRPGTEARVLAYIKKVAADANGTVRLDFVLCTHYHYDHAGGFPAILADPAMDVAVAYFRPPDETSELAVELHRRVTEAAAQRNIPVEETIPAEPFALGAMQIEMLNLVGVSADKLGGENDSSVCTLVSANGIRALLTADITNLRGRERELGEQTGMVDLLKLSHHGYAMSNSQSFLRALRPKLAVVTNGLGQVYPNVRWNLVMTARIPYYSTVRENGIIAHLAEDGEIHLTGDLHNDNSSN